MNEQLSQMQLSRAFSLGATGVFAVGLVIAAFIGVGPLTGLVTLGFLAITLGGAYMAARLRGGDGDVTAILTGRKDERQEQVDRLATTIAGLTLLLLCGAGAIVSLASGDGSGGPFALVLAVSGIVYVASVLILRTRS